MASATPPRIFPVGARSLNVRNQSARSLSPVERLGDDFAKGVPSKSRLDCALPGAYYLDTVSPDTVHNVKTGTP